MKVTALGAVTAELASTIVAYAPERQMNEIWDSFPALLHKASYGTSNYDAEAAGRLHLVPWHYGLGWTTPDQFDENYHDKLQLNPIAPALTATLIRIWAGKDRAALQA